MRTEGIRHERSGLYCQDDVLHDTEEDFRHHERPAADHAVADALWNQKVGVLVCGDIQGEGIFDGS